MKLSFCTLCCCKAYSLSDPPGRRAAFSFSCIYTEAIPPSWEGPGMVCLPVTHLLGGPSEKPKILVLANCVSKQWPAFDLHGVTGLSHCSSFRDGHPGMYLPDLRTAGHYEVPSVGASESIEVSWDVMFLMCWGSGWGQQKLWFVSSLLSSGGVAAPLIMISGSLKINHVPWATRPGGGGVGVQTPMSGS